MRTLSIMRPGEVLWAADLGLLPTQPHVLTSSEMDFVIEVIAGSMNFEMAPTKGPSDRATRYRLAQNPRVQDARRRMLALCDQVLPRPVGAPTEDELFEV
jgi:hypothetical protein